MTSPNQLSFLPDDYLERKTQRRTNVICAALFVIVLIAISSAFMFTERAIRTVEKQHAEVEKQYADAARRIEQVRQMQDKQQMMAHQAELTASLLEKVPRSFLLAEFTNALPQGVSLLDMNLASHQQAAPPPPKATTMYEEKKQQIEAERLAAITAVQPKKYDVNIELTGVAFNDVQVAQFINSLSRSRLLKDVNLVIVEEFTLDTEKVRKFKLEMTLNPDAEVQSPRSASKTAAVSLGAK